MYLYMYIYIFIYIYIYTFTHEERYEDSPNKKQTDKKNSFTHTSLSADASFVCRVVVSP